MAVTSHLCAAEKKTRPASRARRRLRFCRSRAVKPGPSPICPKAPATQSGLPTARPSYFSVRPRRKTSRRKSAKRRNSRARTNQRNPKPPRTPQSQNRRSRKANTNPTYTLSTARSTATTTKAILILNATITFGCSMCLPHPTSSQSPNSSPPESSTKPSLSGAMTARAFTSSPGVSTSHITNCRQPTFTLCHLPEAICKSSPQSPWALVMSLSALMAAASHFTAQLRSQSVPIRNPMFGSWTLRPTPKPEISQPTTTSTWATLYPATMPLLVAVTDAHCTGHWTAAGSSTQSRSKGARRSSA